MTLRHRWNRCAWAPRRPPISPLADAARRQSPASGLLGIGNRRVREQHSLGRIARLGEAGVQIDRRGCRPPDGRRTVACLRRAGRDAVGHAPHGTRCLRRSGASRNHRGSAWPRCAARFRERGRGLVRPAHAAPLGRIAGAAAPQRARERGHHRTDARHRAAQAGRSGDGRSHPAVGCACASLKAGRGGARRGFPFAGVDGSRASGVARRGMYRAGRSSAAGRGASRSAG